jgi:hypothetical protein
MENFINLDTNPFFNQFELFATIVIPFAFASAAPCLSSGNLEPASISCFHFSSSRCTALWWAKSDTRAGAEQFRAKVTQKHIRFSLAFQLVLRVSLIAGP